MLANQPTSQTCGALAVAVAVVLRDCAPESCFLLHALTRISENLLFSNRQTIQNYSIRGITGNNTMSSFPLLPSAPQVSFKHGGALVGGGCGSPFLSCIIPGEDAALHVLPARSRHLCGARHWPWPVGLPRQEGGPQPQLWAALGVTCVRGGCLCVPQAAPASQGLSALGNDPLKP